LALRSTGTESLPYLIDHLGGNVDGVPGVDGVKQYLLKLLFSMAFLAGLLWRQTQHDASPPALLLSVSFHRRCGVLSSDGGVPFAILTRLGG
jgi:hypothetical protein